ncbi:MAG TPA: hypothetical protein VF736_01010 [Pyrinomonadaceae bacterium]|jgi:hypothetical protein
MKSTKNSLKGILLALLFVSACAGAARAGDRDARVISARAGGVNFVSGDVKVRRADTLEWRALTASDELKSGDAVATGPSGRVEVLLNPGSYFRAGGGAEFTLASASLDDLRVELARGSVVVEATGYEQLDLDIAVATPRTVVHIVRTGVYRINALPGGEAEVVVSQGRAIVAGLTVKGGKVARTGAAGVEVSKFDKKWRDDLDYWSRDRAKELARINDRFQRRTLRNIFEQNSLDGIFGSYRQVVGLWVFDAATRCYTFLPFYGYWRSPYGFGYGTGVIFYPSQPWSGRYPPAPGYPTPGTSAGNPGGSFPGGSLPGGSSPGMPGPPTGHGASMPSQPMPREMPAAPPTPRGGGERSPAPRQRDN